MINYNLQSSMYRTRINKSKMMRKKRHADHIKYTRKI